MGIARAVALVWLLCATPSSAATFTKIADGFTPGAPWTQGSVWFGAPAVDQGVVAFMVNDILTGDGIYTVSGGTLTTIANHAMLVPGSSTQNFAWFSDPSISQGTVAFVANDPDFFSAVYTGSGGAITVVANRTTPNPNGSGTLNVALQTPAIDGANVAFRASGGSTSGFYTSVAGVLEISADTDTEIPGGGDGLFFSTPTPGLDGTQVVFDAFSDDVSGVYVADGGAVRVVADTSTQIPGGQGNFISFLDTPSIGGGSVAFTAIGESSGGLYAEIGGVLVLINANTLVDGLAVDGDTVAWYGSDGLTYGIWVYRNGVVERVIASEDLLDGKVINYFSFGPHGLDGDQLAFTAHFVDDSHGVFLMTIPEPVTGILLALGLAALAVRRSPSRTAR